jgi:hypothetical protein
MTDSHPGWSVAELLHVLGGEGEADAGVTLAAWQTALAVGLVDLLPAPLARRAEQLVADGLLEAPTGDRPALRLGHHELAMLERLRRRYGWRPRARRR